MSGKNNDVVVVVQQYLCVGVFIADRRDILFCVLDHLVCPPLPSPSWRRRSGERWSYRQMVAYRIVYTNVLVGHSSCICVPMYNNTLHMFVLNICKYIFDYIIYKLLYFLS